MALRRQQAQARARAVGSPHRRAHRRGLVSLGPGARVLHGAVLNGPRPVVLGEEVVVMENAVLCGRAECT